jgi:D-alanine--poly(phosphoribitol) ligase subunit 2
MTTKSEIIIIIYNCIEEINQENGIKISKEIHTKLFGRESELDSLGLVDLIVRIEDSINDKYDVSISIADEKAMSQKHSPFRSIETLVDYILVLLK